VGSTPVALLLRTIPFAALAAAALPSAALAQAEPAAPPPKLHVEGILDDVLNFEDLHDKPSDFLMNTMRGTLRLSGALGPHFEYKVGGVGRWNSGTLHVDNVPFLPPRLRETVVPPDPATGSAGARPYLENEIASDLYVQEAYATIHLSRFYLRAGRQKIQSGTGYAYNPTDLFNRRVPLDPTYEADGFDAVTVGVHLSPTAELQLLAAPRGDAAYRARVQAGVRGATLALQLTSIARGRVDWEQVNTRDAVAALDAGAVAVGDFEKVFRWNQVAMELVRPLRRGRVYAEVGFAFLDPPADPGTLGPDSKDHERLLLGVDYTFASKVRLIAEYMRLGEGRPSGELLTLNDEQAFFKGETLSADEDNAYLEVIRPVGGGFSASLKVLGMLDHAAVGLNPWLYYDPRPNVRVAGSIYGYLGVDESTYSNVGLGAFAEVRLSF
jgi:hypothetical protein